MGGGNGDDDGEGPITIGGAQPYSGPFALYGNMHTAGVEFAIEEINENGGVLGRELELEAADTESNPSEASTIATRMIEQHNAAAIVGPVSSDVVLAVTPVAESQEVPMFITAGGDPEELTQDSRYTYRTVGPNAITAARLLIDLIEDRGYETVGAITADYAWGHAMENALSDELGGDIEFHSEVAAFQESDFAPHLRNLPDEVDLLVGTSHPPGVHPIFQQALEIGMEWDLYTTATAPTTASIETIGEDITQDYTTLTIPDMFTDQFADVAERFYEATGEAFDTTIAAGYTTTHVIAEAIEAAGSTDTVDVSTEIRNIEYDGLYASPVRYTEWGEPDDIELVLTGYESGDSPWPPDSDVRPVEEYRSDPIPAYEPSE
ncbi:hypothetical protein B1756_15995 [Natrarchaeobaculum aegyptiacum]|uniref:Leucine-binding protein domain-containing protein n=2 Tax=Natrarchaeobaculum aegyptiacum TaxID=745377 RepID=A0A2Z2I0K0_9EURY|nr:hypothetical protein B1756_15995 [Natrarchaeobaculum aegyptiacum]